jgi:hypothetical protein
MARIAGVSARHARLGGRFNLALGVGAAGFSAGTVCAVPAVVSQSASASR